MASQLDFGFVPTKEQVKRSLVVKNTGDIPVGLTWKLEAPFGIEPPAASIAPGQAASFEVSFQPMEACSYNVNALCQLDTGISTTVQVGDTRGGGGGGRLMLVQAKEERGGEIAGGEREGGERRCRVRCGHCSQHTWAAV